MPKTSTTTSKQNKNEQSNFLKKIKEIKKLMKENPELLSDEQKIIFELYKKAEEYEKVMPEQIRKLENEWKKLLKEQEEINKERTEIKEEHDEISEEWNDIKEEREELNEEQDEINEEWDDVYKEWDGIFEEWNEIDNGREELDNVREELLNKIDLIENLVEFYKQHKDWEKNETNYENFWWFDKLQTELSKAQDEFNNAIEFIQKNKDTLSSKWIEIPNRISKHFESLEVIEKRAFYRIWIIWWSDKTNKVFNGWKKNRQGCFWIKANQLELLWDYNKQHDNKFAKQIHDSLEFNDLDFIIFLQSDHETKLIELEKDFPNRVTILWRRWVDDNDGSIQRFSNWRFLHYLEQALKKYEWKEND